MMQGVSVIADSINQWPSALEHVVLGTNDPQTIARMLEQYCQDQFQQSINAVLFYNRSVGAVFGVGLSDGSKIVVKVHRPEIVRDRLDGVLAVQRHLADAGLPVPSPRASPVPLGLGIATAEDFIDRGRVGDGHDPEIRRGLAKALHTFVAAATPLLGAIDVRATSLSAFPESGLWPTPHDVRFDFTLEGAKWIDDQAARARARLDRASGRLVIGHADWRVENLRMRGSDVVAIFDWDSVGVMLEPVLIGTNAGGFTANWSDPSIEHVPSLDESRAFAHDYESARDRPFTDSEWETSDAALLYLLAYGARCEHSDAVAGILIDRGAGHGFRDRLRERGDRPVLYNA